MNKKGQIGMEYVKAVALAFLIISIIALAMILSLTSLRNVSDTLDKTTGSINETKTLTNLGGGNATSVVDIRGLSLTSITVSNSSSGAVVPSTNYSTLNGRIYPVAGSPAWNGSIIRIQAGYSYPTPNTENVVQNITGSVTTFFGNTGTIFSILAVVVIILAITIIIYAVSKFGGGSSNL